MFIKLLVGPAASGKSTYTRTHRSEDDIVAFTIGDNLHIEDQNVAYRIRKSTSTFLTLDNHFNVKGLAKDQINGSNFVSLCGIYLNTYDKELTLWIGSNLKLSLKKRSTF